MSYELEVFRYGEDEDQFFRLMTPILPPHSPPLAHGRPVAVLIHGGYWKQQYHIDNALLDQVAPSLCDLGYAVMILEYRRGREALDGGRGGWPNTNLDIALSLQKLETLATSSSHAEVLNLKKVVLIGHSAGGTLALWPCCAQTEMFGITLSFTPLLCVAIAPIGDLVQGFERKLSDNQTAVRDYVGCTPCYVNAEELETLRTECVAITSEQAVIKENCGYR
jgi:acetyl esterase/lipase